MSHEIWIAHYKFKLLKGWKTLEIKLHVVFGESHLAIVPRQFYPYFKQFFNLFFSEIKNLSTWIWCLPIAVNEI